MRTHCRARSRAQKTEVAALSFSCTKELGLYKDENTKLQAVVDKLVADGACDHDVKKQARCAPDDPLSPAGGSAALAALLIHRCCLAPQKEVLEENVNIIPSAISRLQDAYENLWSLCEEHSGTAAVTESPVWAEAQEIIKAAEAVEEVNTD